MKYGVVINSMIFCLCSIAVAKPIYSQEVIKKPVNIRFSQASLDDALDELSAKLGVKIAYRQKLVDRSALVNQVSNGETLATVLTRLLTPYRLTYYMVDNVIVIAKQGDPAAISAEIRQIAKEIEIKGVVRDTTGAALPGVSVMVKNSKVGTVTDQNGGYRLKADANATLTFNYIGFDPREVQVSGRTTIDVSLQSSVSSLQDVVVVGYGTVKKVMLPALWVKLT